MTIDQIIQLTEARLGTLQTNFNIATQSGDIELVMKLQGEMDDTLLTLKRLRQVA